QQGHFHDLADAGAIGVSGSHAHHAQGFGFRGDSFVHYGLGNFIFDQMDMLGTRQTFVDVYVFYQGRLLSVDIYTYLIEDYARPRPMTESERAEFLQTIFEFSNFSNQGQ
ncbi:MAG TPA: CapA family protein, partial [Anaerolineae bacterium]|nr:CapA family protein [Anaerolineae bacterium]